MRTVTVDDDDIVGQFAVHRALTKNPAQDSGWCITHIPSGMMIVAGMDVYGSYLWQHAEGALRFARELDAVFEDGDVEQDEHGTWRATKSAAKKYRAIKRKLGYAPPKRGED
jgi:hypothetical protein